MVQQIFYEILMGVNFIIHVVTIGIAVVNFRIILKTGVSLDYNLSSSFENDLNFQLDSIFLY
jgi:hypothetical protein